jgi:nucleotide-binding universal stress UspA family protein
MTQRVLVPYDSSEQAEYALTHAVTEFQDADIVLLHVIEPVAEQTGGPYTGANYKQELETAETMLENVRETYDEADRIETNVEYGRPVHGVVSNLKKDRFDHVVMGSHGRDGASRLLLGSVAETVARRSPVPVTVVRSPSESQERAEQVLVPFDASAMAERALEHALDQFEEADVTALYVAYPTDDRDGTGDSAFDVFENWEDERTDHVESVLTAATEIAGERNRSVDTESIDGTPADAIVEFAKEHDVDHVVLGSTGRDGLARLLLGSVAETVIRRSPASVTVVK